jgi:hypothetical protein
MDAEPFDTLTRALVCAPSRRGLLVGLVSGLLAALPLVLAGDDVAASEKRRKKRRKRRRNRCSPNCSDRGCGSDGCGGACGECAANQVCQEGICICTPNCVGKVCGPDGCGGSCGSCAGDALCDSGTCVCTTVPLASCCRVSSFPCLRDEDCCSGNCNSISPTTQGICVGRATGQPCAFNAQCASNRCIGGACAT